MTTTMTDTASSSRQKGVSLIELMIAMAIGLVIVATIGYAYLGAKTSFLTQNALATVQENARFAFELMGNDIRMAGFTGGPVINEADPALSTVVTQPAAYANMQDLKLNPLKGFQDAAPAFIPAGRPWLRGDVLTVVHADNDNENTLTAMTATDLTLNSWPASSAPAVNGIFVAADYTHAAAFTVTAIDSAAKTVTTADDLSNFTGAVAARKLYPLSGVTYYIANNPGAEPALYRLRLDTSGATQTEELIDGVQNMQITYGVDTDAVADKAVNAYCTADIVNAGAGNCSDDGNATAGVVAIPGTTPKEWWKRVCSVRIRLTLTTKQTERISTTGTQLTKSFTTTFAVRNRTL